MKIPGLVDVHVHLRVPGGDHKEDFISGSAAALVGGFTQIMAMPNTQPPIHSLALWQTVQAQARQEGLCDIFLFAGTDAAHVDELKQLGQAAPAIKLYLDQTYTNTVLRDPLLLESIIELWPGDKVIAVHAEGDSLHTAIQLADKYRRRMHICHVSRKEDIEAIASAKQRGLSLTCEVTPHHLFLSQADAARLGALGDMRPRLGDARDVQALWAHINTTIDCVASDHAPHTLAEKNGPEPPPGVPGLESSLPLMLTAVNEKRLSMQRLLELMLINPRSIYGLPEQPETWVEIDPQARYSFPEYPLHTKCGWSPFSGMPMQGRILRVVLRGQAVYHEGRIISPKKIPRRKNEPNRTAQTI